MAIFPLSFPSLEGSIPSMPNLSNNLSSLASSHIPAMPNLTNMIYRNAAELGIANGTVSEALRRLNRTAPVTGCGGTSINDLKTNITRYPLLVANKYKVYISSPKSSLKEELCLNCSAMGWPGSHIGTIDSDISLGPIRKIPNQEIHNDVSLTFYVTKSMAEVKFFKEWHKLITGQGEGFYIGYYSDFIGLVKLETLDESGCVTANTTLYEAYPINISDIDFSYAASDIATVTVDFAYHHHS